MKTRLMTAITCNRCGRRLSADNFAWHRSVNDRGYPNAYRRQPCNQCRTEIRRAEYVPAKPRIKTCVKCGQPFTARGNQKYCHDPCVYEPTYEYNYAPVPRETRRCAVCNQEFGAVANQILCGDPGCKRQYKREWTAAYMREKRASDLDFCEAEKARLRRREHRIAELPSTLTIDEWEETLEFFGGRCAYCGRESKEIHQEHFIPVAMGGGYTKENIVPSCPDCNYAKNAIDPYEWLTAQPDGMQIFAHIARYLGGYCEYT